MLRRLLSPTLVVALLAACASQPARPVAPPPTPAPQPSQPPPPAPVSPVTPPAASGDMVFDAWAADFFPRAVAAGISPDVLQREFAGLRPDPRVGGADARQPEFSKPFSEYIKGTVTDGRAAMGAAKRSQIAQFDAIEQTYGVPREILIAVWAMESGFGAIQGDYDVVRSMATLAAQGRRRTFAETELIAALKIIQSGEATRAQLKGSWAGAMGQTQFIPSSYLSTAVDADGDGKPDIWNSPADSLASAANLLAKGGWVRGQSWAREVIVPPGFDWSLSEGPKLTPAQWATQGVVRADGLPWTEADQNAQAQLVAPTGANGPAFLLFPNHFAIRKYNNSLAYALAVGLLADRFSGMGPLVKPWPQETPLSLSERMTAQRALAVLGYDAGAPDGLVGLKTRAALRAWQKKEGLVADGYLTPALVQQLGAQAQATQSALSLMAPSQPADPGLGSPLSPPLSPPRPTSQDPQSSTPSR
ncbi:lytic murein transglycosylase [Phenylobacterium soli]|uniref:Lytic murein transglycosylase n=1 Tax=Phenylobacterium soli TaxID=2170551 RepID=A0A328AEH2_9CAUL|nr:lytic murein transglycosylase [Phenylobacterium soli]RAK53192.1 lytic murein transglycosylase [Phenylobacterium soli]